MEAVWAVFYGIAGSLGILHGIADALEVSYHAGTVWIWTVLFSALWGVVFGWKAYRKYLIPSAAGVVILAGILRWKEIREGFCRSFERAADAINDYYSVSWEVADYARTGGISTEQTALLAMSVLITCLLVGGLALKKGRVLLAGLFLMGFLAPFLIGKVPEDQTVWELLIGIVGLLALQVRLPGSRQQPDVFKRVNRVLIGFAVVALVGGAYFLEPFLQTVFPAGGGKQKEALEEVWQNIRQGAGMGGSGKTDTAKGGIGNGDLSAAGRLEPGKEPQLKVIVEGKPQTELYLCGYIGTTYDGERWERLARGARDQLGRREELEARKGDTYRWLSKEKEAGQLSAEYLDTEKIYQYLPYGSKVGMEQDVWGDTYVKGTGRPVYRNSFCELSESDWQERTGRRCGEVLREASEYDAFVAKQYLQIEEKQKEILRQIRLEGDTLLEIAVSMKRWMNENTSYSLSPGKVPQGKEYVEYFLFENRKGYCVQYATAATLLFRSYGIPARFVSGYLIEEDQWKQTGDGRYEVTATGEDAHAWTEIYTGDGIWVPVELTPAYGGSYVPKEENAENGSEGSMGIASDPLQEDPQENQNTGGKEQGKSEIEDTKKDEKQKDQAIEEEEQRSTDESTEDKEDFSKEKAETEKGMSGKQKTSVTEGIKFFILLILTAITGIGSRRFYKVRKRRGIFEKSRNEKVQQIFSSIYEVLRFAGMEENDCLGEAFAKEAGKICSGMEAQMKMAQEMALRAWYGKKTVSEKEERTLRRIYRKVCRNIVQELTFWKKVLFYFAKCFL